MAIEIGNYSCQHKLFSIGRILVMGFTDTYSAFYTDEKEVNAFFKNEKTNHWDIFRFRRICTLPFAVKYKRRDSDYVFKVHPQIWLKGKKVS